MTKIAIFFIDALGPDLITQENMPFLSSLKRKAQYYEMNTLLGYSGTIHPSLWTSTYPQTHLLWSTVIKLPKPLKKEVKDKMLSLFPDSLSRPANYLLHYSRLARSRILPSVSPKYSHHFGKSEYDYYHATKQVNGVKTLFSYADTAYRLYNKVEYISPWKNQQTALDVYFTSEVDALSHLRLATPKKMRKLLRKVDRKVKQLHTFYQKNFPGSHFMVFSDHGQDVIKKRVNIKKMIDALPLTLGNDFLVSYDSTLARFWVFNEKARFLITRRLSGCKEGLLLEKKERKKYGIDFKDNRYGDIYFLLHTGCEIFPNAYHNYLKNNVQGMHGYLPETRGMKAFLLYAGPQHLVKKKEISILDITPTILQILHKKIPTYMKGRSLCR